jgi:hypothetical protein
MTPTEIEKKLSELRALHDSVGKMMADLEREKASLATESKHQAEQKTARTLGPPHRSRPVRAHVLDCLEDLGWLTFTRELSQYSAARYGRDIPSNRFGPLTRDEVLSYHKGTPRPVWLCFGLTHDRYEPIKRLLGRSDWPLHDRIVAPTTGRVQHLGMTKSLCQVALEADSVAVDPTMLRIIAADHARDLPGIRVKRGEFSLDLWLRVASEELEKVSEEDESLRREAAARLEATPAMHRLFGVPEVVNFDHDRRAEAGR